MRRRSGVSLLEVMLAFAVLVVAVLALLGVMPAAARHQESSNRRVQALYFARQKMDQLLRDNLRLSTAAQADYPFPTQAQGNRTWWGAPDPGGNATLQLVTVDVAWVDQVAVAGAPQVHRVRLQSLINP